MFKVNQNRETSAKQVAAILNDAKMLFSLDVLERGSNFILYIETDQTTIKYNETSLSGMEWFLGKLKAYVNNKEEIDELFDDLGRLQYN